jgi:hypothetical protein
MVIFFSRERSEHISGPAAGDHRIGKNMRNLKLNFLEHFRSILGSIMPIPAIGLNDANCCHKDQQLTMLPQDEFPGVI